MGRKTEILEVARDLFRHYGYAKTSMSDLADAAQLSRTALYKHFPSKDDVFRGLVEQLFGEAEAAAEVAADAAGPFPDRLGRLLRSKVVFHQHLAGSRHGAELLDEGARLCGPTISEYKTRFTRRVATLLAEGVASGALRADLGPVDTVAEVLVRAIDGVGHGPAFELVDPDTFCMQADLLVDLLCRGLTSAPVLDAAQA